MKKLHSMVIGRFAVPEPHEGHKKLIQTLLDEGRNVCVALRDTEISESDPYTIAERTVAFEKVYQKEIAEGRLTIIAIPDITEVVYGRKVGWGIRQINLDEATEAISATKIRAQAEGV